MKTKTHELMTFKEDKKVNGEVVFKAGEVYPVEIATGSVTRWLKRGGVIVEKGYDPGNQDPTVVDTNSGEEIHSVEDALNALGGDEEEVVNEVPKKETKKANKPKVK